LSEDDEEIENSFENSEESLCNSIDEKNDDNNQLTNSNDDKSFYRDFTMKFHVSNTNESTKDSNIQTFKLFQTDDNFFLRKNSFKHVNLTCFISSIEFHVSLVSTIHKICLYINSVNNRTQLKNKTEVFYELIKLFSITYISSLRLEKNYSFKILISKIFYLNYDACCANFINLTKISFISINYLYFEFFFKNFINDLPDNNAGKRNLSQSNFNDLDYELNFKELEIKIQSFNRYRQDIVEHQMSSIHNFFEDFMEHFCQYYLNLNEQSHEFKLDKTFLKNFFQSTKNNDESASDLNKSIEKKVISLFRFYEQNNKAITMLNLAKNNSQNLSTKEIDANLEENISSQSKYVQRDCRFRYQIWSNEMINYFMLNLKNKIYTAEIKSNLQVSLNENFSNNLIQLLVQLIVVFNSCSSYCQCLTFENNNSKADFIKIREISAYILSEIFKQFNI